MLAIVIPFYKFRYFDSCLKSLANQTNKDFTVYVGDDYSPVQPQKLLDYYSGKLNLSYCRFDSNLGGISLVKHWHRCLKLIKDEKWVMLLGDDDLLEPTCVEVFYSNLSKIEHENINVIRYATAVIDKNGSRTSKVFHHPQYESSSDFILRKINGNTRSSLSEYIFRSKLLLKKGFKDLPLGWHTDDLAVLEFSLFKNIYSLNNSTVFFRNSGDNITSQSDNLIEKNKASFLFYFYLLDKKSQFFRNDQKEILLEKFKKSYENDKKDLIAFLKFTKVMIRNRELRDYFDFVKTNLSKSFK